MTDGIFFDGGQYQIIHPPNQDVTVWTDPSIKRLCEFLAEADETQKKYFFTKSFNNTNHKKLPRLFIEPSQTFNPSDKIKSALLDEIEFYQNSNAEIANLIKLLIMENVLVKDELKILKCKCGNVSISYHFKVCPSCQTDCKKQVKRELFHLKPEVSSLFYSPGRVIEGVVYFKLKHLESFGLEVFTNMLIRGGESSQTREVDIVLKRDKDKKVLVIHITINSSQDREKTIFKLTANQYRIQTIFATIEREKHDNPIVTTDQLSGGISKIFWDIATDKDFFSNLEKEILNYFNL